MESQSPAQLRGGDCALVTNRLTGQRQWSPMGSSANLEGRTLAQGLAGRKKTYPGVLGTGVVKLPGLNCGRTGLTEAQAKEAGYDVATILAVTDDKAHYYPDAAFFITKLIADRKTHQLLGMQVLGPGAVDKMVDIAVTGLNLKARLEDFENADYAYAPPFSTAIHPFVQAVYLLLNKLDGTLVSMTPAEYAAGAAQGYRIIDVAPRPGIPVLLSWSLLRPRRNTRHRQGGKAAAGVRAGQACLFPAEPAAVLRVPQHSGTGRGHQLQRSQGSRFRSRRPHSSGVTDTRPASPFIGWCNLEKTVDTNP